MQNFSNIHYYSGLGSIIIKTFLGLFLLPFGYFLMGLKEEILASLCESSQEQTPEDFKFSHSFTVSFRNLLVFSNCVF